MGLMSFSPKWIRNLKEFFRSRRSGFAQPVWANCYFDNWFLL